MFLFLTTKLFLGSLRASRAIKKQSRGFSPDEVQSKGVSFVKRKGFSCTKFSHSSKKSHALCILHMCMEQNQGLIVLYLLTLTSGAEPNVGFQASIIKSHLFLEKSFSFVVVVVLSYLPCLLSICT